MSQAILLTGRPGCGKTTLIRRVLARISLPAGGVYTQEIRERGVRKGFEIITLAGDRGILAHVGNRGRQRIGRYGVDISALDRLGVAAIRGAIAAQGVVVIDEIGPMEILSRPFRAAVLEALDSDATVLGTIVRRSIPFTDQIKSRPDVRVMEIRPDNREALFPALLDLLRFSSGPS